jgi:hypothetical protein
VPQSAAVPAWRAYNPGVITNLHGHLDISRHAPVGNAAVGVAITR